MVSDFIKFTWKSWKNIFYKSVVNIKVYIFSGHFNLYYVCDVFLKNVYNVWILSWLISQFILNEICWSEMLLVECY